MAKLPRWLTNRNSLFARWLITALAVSWVYLVVTDYQTHAVLVRVGLHWVLAISTAVQATTAWAEHYQNRRRDKTSRGDKPAP